MADVRPPDLVRFGRFELDLATADLHQNGGKIRLPEQQFQILEMLLRGQGGLVSREEIRKRLWPNDTVVEFDRSINAAIKKLRAALEDSAEAPSYIETVARRGYRILVEVQFPEAAPPAVTVRRTVDGSLAGQRVSHYRVLTLLGGGGMGLVYKAEGLKLNRPVALKFLPEELASESVAIQRFEREAKAASALNHPNICTIHGVEEYGTQPFIVMELLEGESLRELISRYAGPAGGTSHLPLQQLLEIAVQIASGLEAAHEKGIVHRDIKPANIFVTTRGQVKILDFGLAKLTVTETDIPSGSHEEDRIIGSGTSFGHESSIEFSLSRTGIAMGTAGYMSPEQVRGEKLDARTDLFSFGLILFEMATGQRAFSGDTAAIVHNAILHRTLPPIRELNPELPEKLEEIIGKALERDRESRYQTSAEMLVDLKSTLKTLQVMSPAASIEASPVPAVLSTLRAGIFIGGGLLLLLGAITLLWWRFLRPSPHAEITERQLTVSASDNPIFGPAISGDGKYLVFGDNFGLHVRSLESGETRDISNPTEIGDAYVYWNIHWFPDSTRFFAVSHPHQSSRTTTWQASVMGGELHKFRDEAEVWSVSPDGSSVAMTMANQQELWVMGASGENAHKVRSVGEKSGITSVQWSPDGTRLLYVKGHDYWHPESLDMQDLKSGRQFTLLSDPQLRDLLWLRDGRVVFVKANPGFVTTGETCDYWVARIDERTNAFGSKPIQLTHNRGFCIGSTSATADSKRLVFTKNSYEMGVYVANVEADGNRITPPRHLTVTEGVEYPNGWTADSREVVLTSNRDQKCGIYRQPLDGGAAQPILLTKTVPPEDEWGFPRPSRDGGWLLIEHNMYRYLINSDLFRVPMTGGKEELIAQDIIGLPSCAAASSGLCAYSKKEKNQLIFTSFDPQLKQKRELGRFTMDPNPRGEYDWLLSPDATKIAIVEASTDNIYLLNLKTQSLQHIVVKHWSNFASMDWTADGKGLVMFSNLRGGVLLHVDLHGNAHVLWEPHISTRIWALTSPDGKHVAMPLDLQHANVWMMENF
jgi:serine/threonine protein kinase/DNA-binding winged helix-turn-helix (wHTH) protein/Tol biopolymer transport system component